jgi:hypothetical protein
MSKLDRAAQFASFAALTGHSEAVQEEARLVDSKIELNDEQIFELNTRFNYICDNISSLPEVTITYFVPDSRKQGGAYLSVVCKIKKIDVVNRIITTADGTEIKIDDILEIVI